MGTHRMTHKGGGATRKQRRQKRAKTRLTRHHRSRKHKKHMKGGSRQTGGGALAEALVPLGLLTGLFMTKKRRSVKSKTARKRRR